MTVYLLHFARPIGNPRTPHGQAQHYIGFTRGDAVERFKVHLSGSLKSPSLTRAVVAAGIEIVLVKVWEKGSRELEKQLKATKNAHRLCPFCHKAYLTRRRAYRNMEV